MVIMSESGGVLGCTGLESALVRDGVHGTLGAFLPRRPAVLLRTPPTIKVPRLAGTVLRPALLLLPVPFEHEPLFIAATGKVVLRDGLALVLPLKRHRCIVLDENQQLRMADLDGALAGIFPAF